MIPPNTPYPLPELAERVVWDLNAAVHPALVGQEAVVMDTARDLMEISSLAHEFKIEPQRIPKWTSGVDRDRELGYRKLIRKQAEHGVSSTTVQLLIDEYRALSETLHPAAHRVRPAALTKRPVELDIEWWLPLMLYELFRHGADAVAQLEAAAQKLSQTAPAPLISALGKESILRVVREELYDYQQSLISNRHD